ncbi:MAG: 16S rRNA processing protein RimM [Bacteroidales bacterium]|nr:MAG: 16S rRNA processing protein RimM [Bacteroidales bacterium]
MFNKENLYFLGTLVKTHGVKGSCVLALNNLHPEEILEVESVFIEIDGLLVPFFISGFSDLGRTSILVTFDNMDSNAKAREFIGCKIYISADKVNISDDLYSKAADFTGYKVVDSRYGDIGKITEVMDIRENPLFKVRSGNNEYMIPVNENIIKEINHNKKVIFTDLPEGLLDI